MSLYEGPVSQPGSMASTKWLMWYFISFFLTEEGGQD